MKNRTDSGTYNLKPTRIILVVALIIVVLSFQAAAEASNTGSLGDWVWEDLNGNGIQDAGEPGIEGVTVNLYKCCSMILVASTQTDSNGYYYFEDMPANLQSYYIEFVLPIGWKFTIADVGDHCVDSDVNPATGLTVCTNLANGEVDYSWDAGMVRSTNEIPEFPTMALPMAAIIGMALVFRRRKE